jgi:hypothetical protein
MTKRSTDERAELKAKPACFSDAGWKVWSAGASWCKPTAVDWACTDCTPEFKARALEAGKCSWPCVRFYVATDGGIEGRRMSVSKRRIGLDEVEDNESV